jgi:RimJ/RimL family protein N-acetyltransferase
MESVDQVRYRELSFEQLKEQDLPLIYSWLREPHVREFYHRKGVSSWEETRDHYRERLAIDWPTKCFLSCVGRPIGYIQTYRVADYPDYAATIDEVEGISVDLFIGDADHLGIGWGRLILVKFLNEVAFPMFPGENVCWIYHEKLNQRALRASQAAGFRYVRDFIEDGSRKELLRLTKEECARLVLSRVTR